MGWSFCCTGTNLCCLNWSEEEEGGGRKGGRGEEAFLWPFLDLSLTSPGEFKCDFRKQKVTKWTVLEKQNKQKLKQKRKQD